VESKTRVQLGQNLYVYLPCANPQAVLNWLDHYCQTDEGSRFNRYTVSRQGVGYAADVIRRGVSMRSVDAGINWLFLAPNGREATRRLVAERLGRLIPLLVWYQRANLFDGVQLLQRGFVADSADDGPVHVTENRNVRFNIGNLTVLVYRGDASNAENLYAQASFPDLNILLGGLLRHPRIKS
jgi:hypothetical protein